MKVLFEVAYYSTIHEEIGDDGFLHPEYVTRLVAIDLPFIAELDNFENIVTGEQAQFIENKIEEILVDFAAEVDYIKPLRL